MITIRNKHAPECGEMPTIDSDECDYISVYENESGEQWVFFKRKGSNVAQITGGDIDWQVLTLDELQNKFMGGIVMDRLEQWWVKTCTEALAGRE